MSGTLFFRVVDVISVIAEFSMCRTVIAVNVETLYGGRCSQCLYHAAVLKFSLEREKSC